MSASSSPSEKPIWIPEHEAIAHIAEAIGGSFADAARTYVEAAARGALVVRGRTSRALLARQMIERELWFTCDPEEVIRSIDDYTDVEPAALTRVDIGFIMLGGDRWFDREVKFTEVAELWGPAKRNAGHRVSPTICALAGGIHRYIWDAGAPQGDNASELARNGADMASELDLPDADRIAPESPAARTLAAAMLRAHWAGVNRK